MRTSSITLLTAVIAISVAGCSSIAFDGGSGSPDSTVTPAPVPTSSDMDSLRGIGPEAVTDPALAGATHGSVLRDTSYTVTSNRTVTDFNGTTRSQVRTRIERQPNGVFRADVTIRGPHAPVLLGRPPAQATFWSDGDRYFRKLDRDNKTVYNEFTPVNGFAGTVSFWVNSVALDGPPGRDATTVFELFRSLRVQETPGAETTAMVTGHELTANESITRRLSAPDDASLVARVRSDGLITAYRLSYTARTDDDTRVRVQRTVRFSAVGETTVERPVWYDRIENDSTPTPSNSV